MTNFMNVKVEHVSYANELQAYVSALPLTTIMRAVTSEACYVDPATKFSVTFEMTIKPLPEEPSTSGSHPLTDGSGE
jgi:hypothetical protein